MKFVKIREVKSPKRVHRTDSGIDFFVPENKDLFVRDIIVTPTETLRIAYTPLIMKDEDGTYMIIEPGIGFNIPSGIKIVLEEGFDLVFENKSGVSVKKGLIIGAKVVDNSYRGEIHLHIINTSKFNQKIYFGEKIAQGIIRKVETTDLVEISEERYKIFEDTERGEGGFGSSGNK